MSTQAFQYLAKEIDQLRNDQAVFLMGGGAKDFAEYRHLTGVITGLTSALERLKDLRKHDEEI